MRILLDSCVWGKARADLESGAIVTAEPGRLRIRLPQE
jgi:hypothetical protein